MGGSQTISTSADRIEAFNPQSSSAGVCIPWVRGRTKIAPNLLWYNGFKAIPYTEVTGGGKGGSSGVTQENTTYSYVASIAMGVGHGPLLDIPRIWRGKEIFWNGIMSGQIELSHEDWTVPDEGAMSFEPAHGGQGVFAAVICVTAANGNSSDMWSNVLAPSIDYVVNSAGTVTLRNSNWRGETLTIHYQWFSGTDTDGGPHALQQLGLTLLEGHIGQAQWTGLNPYPDQQVNYSGVAFLGGVDYRLSDGASVENHNLEVVGPLAYHLDSSTADVDMSIAVRELMLDGRAGAGFPGKYAGNWRAWSDYTVAAGILGSLGLTTQQRMADVLEHACRMTITHPVWSDGILKMIPFADQAESGRGRSYTPDLTPLYDLDDDCYTRVEQPVRYRRKTTVRRYNHWRVQYKDRANNYSVAIAEAKDAADITARGVRSAEIVDCPWICTVTIARKVAQLLLQRSIAVVREFEVDLPEHFSMIEPAEFLTVTDLGPKRLGLDRAPVRVLDITENDAGDLTLVVEDYLIGAASAADYDHQYPDGYIHDYNVAPGKADSITVFEAPVTLTTTGLELYIAVSGSGANWGGAHVWVSVDGEGTNYKRIGTVYGPARHGRLKTTVGSTVRVQLYDTDAQLYSGTPDDASALSTLVYIGGENPEYLAYETANLNAPGDYTLGGLVRKAYLTLQSAHAVDDPFVRVDDSIAKSGALSLDMIGKQVSIKCTSFNVYGGAEESLAEVSAVRYLITGYMAKLPPSAPTGGSYVLESFGVRLICARNPEPDVDAYEWHGDDDAATEPNDGNLLDANGGTSYPWRVRMAGPFKAWVAAVDRFKNRSAFALIEGIVPGAQVINLAYAFDGPDVRITYETQAGAFAVASVNVRYGGTSWDNATAVSGATLTSFQTQARWGGTRRWRLRAVDVAGNEGDEATIDVLVVLPGPPTSPRSEVVDNNVLLYWDDPATGSLPVMKYLIRKGESFAAGSPIGSNGNSTFTPVFEQVSGVYTYWIAAVDTANNTGAAVGITATVDQPPDYVLRRSWDSDLSGITTNLFLELGTLVGPVDASQTWTTHFTGNSWDQPQDQVDAGLPLYAQPGLASGSYVEIFDYAATLPSTTVTVTVGKDDVAGVVDATCQIAYRLTTGDAWTDAAPGFAAIATNFRYVRVTLTFTADPAGESIMRMRGLNVKLSSKIRTDGGSFEITDAEAGVFVPFNYPFIDCFTPQIQADGLAPRFAVVDFDDIANPTGITVWLYDIEGTEVTGSGSWTIRGF